MADDRAAARAAKRQSDRAGLTDSKTAGEMRAQGDLLRAQEAQRQNTSPAAAPGLADAVVSAAQRRNQERQQRRQRDSRR
jgi:hypothetical protein